jgi:maltose alpha-D-glucosyltransferase/alpha-amylase
MGRFLTEKSPFPHIAPIVGALEHLEDGVEPVTLAVMQKFVENQGDLWTLALEHLGRLLAGGPQVGPQAAAETAAAGFHLGRMALLGRRVAEMHHALAKQTGDPAFDPEPVTAADLDEWRKRALAEVDAAVAASGSRGPELAAARDRLAAKLAIPGAGAAEPAPAIGKPAARDPISSFMKTRFHGDLHLGQVLVAQDDFILVDFEGEPERSLERRREKSSVLRDVAGMLRSFSYAAHAAGRRGAPGGAPASSETVARALGDWERDAARHFLEGYMKAAAGLASIPRDEAQVAQLLQLFLIEKAAYELRYEIANRPDWVEIPLRGLLELATR